MNKNHSLAIAVGAGTVGSVLAYLGYSFYKNTNVSMEKEYVAKEHVAKEHVKPALNINKHNEKSLESPENVKIKRKKSKLQMFYTPDGVGYTEVNDNTADQLSDVTSTLNVNDPQKDDVSEVFLNGLEKELIRNSSDTTREQSDSLHEDSDGFKVTSTPKEIEEDVLSELAKEASSWGQFWKDSYNENDYSDSSDSVDKNADMN